MLVFAPNLLSSPAEIRGAHAGLIRYVEEELKPLSEQQLRWKPSPKSWSVAECAGHLVQAHAAYLKRLDDRLPKLQPVAAPFRSGWLGAYFYKIIRAQPDGKPSKKYKAPSFMQPTQDALEHPHQMLEQLVAQLKRFDRLTELSAEKDWNGVPVPTSLHPLVRIRWGDALRFLAAHNERHLLQAQRVTQSPGFPA